MKIFYGILLLIFRICLIVGTAIFMIVASPFILIGMIDDELREEQFISDINEALNYK